MRKDKIMLPYTIFAAFYDRLMSKERYEEWKKLIKELVKKYDIPRTTVLDLACGTGNMSGRILDLGFNVVGVDKSVDMLKVARKKHPRIKFIQQDFCHLDVSESFDFIVCFYDSLNYLTTDEQMRNTFERVAKHLRPGGIFLFDVNTRDHVAAFQKKDSQIHEFEDFFAIFKNGGRGRFWELTVDLFVRKGKNLYIRFTERHLERGYSRGDISKLLGNTSLKILEVREEKKYAENNKTYIGRLYFIVQK